MGTAARRTVDLSHALAYSRYRMNLLLLLSALLSALTGAVPGVRGQSAQAVAQGSVCAQAAKVAVAKIGERPVAALASLEDVAVSAAMQVIAVSMTPIWASRRRE